MSKGSFSVVDDQRNPLATIGILAWPIFLEQVLVSLTQAVDTAMVGSLGKQATAAVAISQSPNMLINGIFMALGVGFTSLIARSVGAQELERARRLMRQSILVVLALGVPLSGLLFLLARQIPMWMGGEPEILDMAADYNRILALALAFRGMAMMLTAIYRGYGDSRTPLKINVMVNLANVVGNFLMIYPTRTLELFGRSFTMFGFGWGVAGAAISTALSASMGGLLLLVLSFVRKTDMQLRFRDGFAPDWKELSQVVNVSLPAMLERFTMSGAQIVVARVVATLGTAAVAAQNLAGNVEALSFMPGFAFGTAATILFGQSIGGQRPDLAVKYISLTIKLGCAVMLFMSLVLFFGSTVIVGLFTPDQEVIALGAILLKILAVIQIPQVIAMIYSGALRGAGDTKSPFLISLISMWGVRIVGALICVNLLHLGLPAVCVCMCTDNVVRCVLFHLRYRAGSWNREAKAIP